MNETKEIVNETSVHALLEDFKRNKDRFLARSGAGRFGENYHYSVKWLEKFQELYEYKKQYKHCNVPAKYENQSLYMWVQTQRSRYRISKILEERKHMLNAIGFNWTAPKEEIATTTSAFTLARMAKWDDKFEMLKQYKLKHGHCNVPTKKYGVETSHSPSTYQLGNWVRYQRTQYSLMLKGLANNLTKDHIQQLESIEFNQNSQGNIKWLDQFHLLKQYKKEHGTCNIPASYASNESLKNWVQTQRTQYRYMVQGFPTKLSKERRNLLESIGFHWSRKNQTVKQIEESKIMANDDEKMVIEEKYVLITPTKNEKPKIFKQMTNEGSYKELQTNGMSHASVDKSEYDAQIEPASSNAVCHEQEDRKVRHDEQIAREACCTKSRRDNASKRKLEIGKGTDNNSYKCLTSTSDKGTSESVIRQEVHQEQDDSEIRKNNEDFTVKESQTETIDKSSSSLQDKVQILCKISILFREEKDAVHAKIKKRKLDNSL